MNHINVTLKTSPFDAKSDVLFGFYPTPFGMCMLATIEGEICHLGFIEMANARPVLDELGRRWKGHTLTPDNGTQKQLIESIFTAPSLSAPLRISVKGTQLQLKVWNALLDIPAGKAISYEELATRIGHPKAVRAVANAVGQNEVSVLIPCHRVLRKSGALGGFRWGLKTKQALLANEGYAL